MSGVLPLLITCIIYSHPPANNHYKMAGHVAPISRDFSGNQPLKSGVVHFIL